MAEKHEPMLEKIDEIIDFHGPNRSSLIQVLLDVQKHNRWLPKEYIAHISNRLKVPLPQVYQVATFYKAFSLTRRGRHLITVCMGTACHVRGAPVLLDRISQKLGISAGKTTDDSHFTLLTVNCMGCCALGPVLAIDDTYYSNPSSKEFDKIIRRYD